MAKERLQGWFVYAGVWGLHALVISANLSLLPWGYTNNWGSFVVLLLAHAFALTEAARLPDTKRTTLQAAWIATVVVGLALFFFGVIHLVNWLMVVLSIVMVANHFFLRSHLGLYASLAAAVIMLVFSVASPMQQTGLLGHILAFMALLVATLSVARIQAAAHGLLLGSRWRIMAGRGLAMGTAALLSLFIGLALYVVTPQKGLTQLTWSLTQDSPDPSKNAPPKEGEEPLDIGLLLAGKGAASDSDDKGLGEVYKALKSQGMSSANATVLAVKIKVQSELAEVLQKAGAALSWMSGLTNIWWWLLLILLGMLLVWYAHRKQLLLRGLAFSEYIIFVYFVQPTAMEALTSLKKRVRLAGIPALPQETLNEYSSKVKARFPVSSSFLRPIVLSVERELYSGGHENPAGVRQAYIDTWRALRLGL